MCKRHVWEENWRGELYCEKCGQFKNDPRYKTPEPREIDPDEVVDFLFAELSELHAWTSPATLKAAQKGQLLR